MTAVIFRAVWPITDENRGWASLCREAETDLPVLIAQAHARLLRPGRFSIAPSASIPGSGRVTESVLLYEAPAVRAPIRAYRKAAA